MLISRFVVGLFAVSWLPWFNQEVEEPTPEPVVEEPEVVEEPPPPPEPPAPALFPEPLPFHPTLDVSSLGMTYSSSCGGCHSSTFNQWTESTHHTGIQNTAWLDAIRSFGDGTVCTSCHKPFTVQHEQLTTEIIENDIARPVMETNPSWNPTWQSESVGCASCHVREGVVVGSKTSDSPHPVRNSDTLSSSEACQSCHQFQLPDETTPIYNTYQEWKNSAYANAGIQCQDCHMVSGAVIGNGFPSHQMRLSPKQGLTVTLQTQSLTFRRNQETQLSVVVHNTGVGHSWPGSSPFSEKKLLIRLVDDNDKTLMKDIVHPIGHHRDEALQGPSIAVGNQHSFVGTFSLSSRIRSNYAMLQVIYQNGSDSEVIHSTRVEIR